MNYKIIHIIQNDKFIDPFYKLIIEHFKSNEHLFIYISGESETDFSIPNDVNVLNICNKYNGINNFFKLNKTLKPYFDKADKVIIHGLFNANLILFLFLHQKFLRKSYWVMWGGDLYGPLFKKINTLKQKIYHLVEAKVKGGFSGYITYIPGDYELAKELYGAKGKYYECIMYLSNLYSELHLPEKLITTTTILVGNSADPTNNHEEIFKKLSQLEPQNFNVICPLSYGCKNYAEKIKLLGKSIFEDRFTAIIDFMPFDEYLKVLATIDIAVFAHKRQQAMGNIITLLGLGKTVYMRTDITPFAMFNDSKIKVFDINNLSMELLENKIMENNRSNIKKIFSESKLISQWEKVLDTI